MKKYWSNNAELTEILVNAGFQLTCNEDMDIIVSDEDAKQIDLYVSEQAPSAIGDYGFEDYE